MEIVLGLILYICSKNVVQKVCMKDLVRYDEVVVEKKEETEEAKE